jgi:glycosyltransferase involved in cell wall biosynthesis
MRVAIDATPLTLSSGGLLRYTQELSLALAREFPEDRFVLVSDQAFERPAGAPPNLVCGSGPQGALERRWWLWGLDRELSRLSVDLFHGTDFAVPYIPRRPSVLTLHDLSPWMDPGWHFAADRVRARTPLLIELGCATMIVTDTEAVRRQAIERFRIHPGRIAAVPLGGLAVSPVATAPAERPYFLFVGTLEPRKNVEGLIAAWRHVRRQHDVDLVLAGRRREDFAALEPQPGLILRGEVSDAELPCLYGAAVALVYPSRYEGFGLPVLEAMQCGTCTIISRDPALVEVTGDAAIATGDGKELAEAMSTLVARPELAAEWRARAACRGRQFSWGRTARLTREVYDEARKRFSD